ncbi:hypothetical protein X975_03114, partial [Stegodyphus mimosarum]
PRRQDTVGNDACVCAYFIVSFVYKLGFEFSFTAKSRAFHIICKFSSQNVRNEFRKRLDLDFTLTPTVSQQSSICGEPPPPTPDAEQPAAMEESEIF